MKILPKAFREGERRATEVLGALGGVSFVAAFMSILGLPLWMVIALMVATLGVTGALSSWCASARTADLVAARAAAAGAFTAFWLAGVCVPILMWTEGGGRCAIDWPAVLCVGLPLGVVIGLGFLPMLLPAWRARRWASYGAANHVHVRGGRWLVGLGLAILAISVLVWPGPCPLRYLQVQPVVVGLVASIVGAVLGAHGRLGAARRRRWLASVSAGAVPEYRIVPIAELPTAKPVVRFEYGFNECDAALVRIADEREVSYREVAPNADPEPIAWVAR